MTFYVSSLGSRLGDLVVVLPIIDALISRGERVFLVVRSPLQLELAALLTGLAGLVKEHELEEALRTQPGLLCDFFQDINERNCGKRGSVAICEYEKMSMGQRLQLACNYFGLGLRNYESLPLNSLGFDDIPAYRHTAVFVPGATGSSKRWPVKHWLELAHVLEEAGIDVILVGQPKLCPDVAEIAESGVRFVATPRVSDAINLLSSSKFVVSSDTGFMHLSVHQKKTTVSIFNQSTSHWFRSYPHSFILTGNPCTTECLQAADDANVQFQKSLAMFGPVAYDDNKWHGEDYVPCVQLNNRCTAAIKPLHVLSLLHEQSLVHGPTKAG